MTNKQVEVDILGQPYRLICAPEDEARLLKSAVLVDQKMRELSDRSIRGTERLAVMAGLAIASELLKLQQSVHHGEAFPVAEIQRTMQHMNQQIDDAIKQSSSNSSSS